MDKTPAWTKFSPVAPDGWPSALEARHRFVYLSQVGFPQSRP